ncbi:MAG TPA: hypothetical protein VM577_07880 [Anaerovoracaceae bacterium]|nr:hypothetical protein [Anaerovoracaceae bacterium]
MEKNFKKSVAFMIALMMILVSTGFSFASEQPIQADSEKNAAIFRWVGLNTVTGTFEILSGGKANPIVRGTTHAGEVDYVNVIVTLKSSSGSGWTTLKSWNRDITISLNKFTFNETYTVGKNYSYQYSAAVKSYKDDVLLDSVTIDSKILKY